ncbi:hypothetical protein DY000_02011027 [Brassica cretica]|uniref:CRM domain-containing protein n=1 Tax=Brassica cretica TaxID=69181 RepID=A0ABQ7D3M5_BRACR|nr:hypothetical protein DY000_02011027 [Brassica cretica]
MFARRSLSRTCKWSLSSLLHSDSCSNLVLSSNPITSNVMMQPGSSSEGKPQFISAINASSRQGMGSSYVDIERKKHEEQRRKLRFYYKNSRNTGALTSECMIRSFSHQSRPKRSRKSVSRTKTVPVGVRGVFGGVVQNMHMPWKFHETVQVCCDNFPKEKIKEMATMIARLSGGVVINVHHVKTIIMFRGRNYRQPKNLIPVNTLTKRKALFKARFEQALESQKLNIKKTEQQLRRTGVNPEDPVAMASIQRVASTVVNTEETEPVDEDSDQEELDRFIAEIEEAADKEWEEEEAAEEEESGRIRYWNREEFAGRNRGPYGGDSSHGFRRNERDTRNQRRSNDSDDSDQLDSEDDVIPKRFDRPTLIFSVVSFSFCGSSERRRE